MKKIELITYQKAEKIIALSPGMYDGVVSLINSENKVLSLTRKPTYYINKEMAIGLGWFIKNPLSDKEICFHNGGTGGFTSCMAFSTNNKTGVIVLSNINMEHKEAVLIDKLCFKLMDYLD